MLRRILFIVFICIAVAATIVAYLYLRSAKKPKKDIGSLIPASCSYVIECDNFLDFNKKLRENSLIWEELVQDECFKELDLTLTSIDSLISLSEEGKQLFENNRVYLAGIKNAKSIDNLVAMNLPAPGQEALVVDFLKKHLAGFENSKLANGEEVHKVSTRRTKELFYVYCSSGVLLISKQQSLIEQSLSPDNKALNTDKHFLELEEDGGNNMDARIYLRNSYYQQLLSPMALKGFGLTSEKEWTALDFNSLPNEIRLNGFIDADSSAFLQVLKSQEPVEVKFTHVTPSNASGFSFLGISDYPAYATRMVPSDETNKFSERTEAGLVNDWTEFFSGEFALVDITLNGDRKRIGLASVSDNGIAAKFFKHIADTTLRFQKNDEVDSVFYSENKSLFSLLTGNLLNADFGYYYVSKEYVMFAESDSLIRRYLTELQSYGNLAKTDRFETSTLTNLNSECNYYHYQDLSKTYHTFKSYISEEVSSTCKTIEERLKKFGFLGVQLSSHKGKILTQSSLQYNPVTKNQSLTLWETQLDTVSSQIPQVLINHKTGGKELFVADDAGTIYLISNTGKIQWKKQLKEKPMSTVYQVDFFKNGKLQMLFNTENYVHLIDRNGNYVAGYPIKLESAATNPLAVYDYENTKDYRILLACKNKKVYNYNINGKITEGFNFPVTQEEVNLKIEFVRINAKDYLLAIDKAGNVYGTGRKGETRLTFKNKLASNVKNYYLDEGKDISKSILWCMDINEPAIKQLTLSDKAGSNVFNTEIKIADIRFAFVNEDRLVDCIISDESGFEVLDDQGNKLVSYLSKTDSKPGVKSVIVDDQVYFLLIDKNSQLHLVDVSGKRLETPGTWFSELPIITDINADSKLYIIGVLEDKVNCYSFNQ